MKYAEVIKKNGAVPPMMVREAPLSAEADDRPGVCGLCTVKDWEALPDDVRMELIDGILYDMAQPSVAHQTIQMELLAAFYNFVRAGEGGCRIFPAPLGVRLDRDDRSMLLPDIVVVCDPKKLLKKWCNGEPDLVVEILSPSTGKRDRGLKERKYRKAGVREYWIVDPERQEVEVYCYGKSEFPVFYTFSDRVPVGIWDGALEVDFSEIRERLPEIAEDAQV